MIVGLTGKKQSGKSTAAAYLCAHHDFEEKMFAAPLKEMAAIVLDTDPKYFQGSEAQKNEPIPYWNVTGREFLQRVGTELFRNELPKHLPQLEGFWLKRLEKNLREAAPGSRIVVSDVRFQDEANMIRRLGGKIVGIIVPYKEDSYEHVDIHESENQIIECDAIIVNQKNNSFYDELDRVISG